MSYVVNARDLTPSTLGNVFCKYADDTYLVIPASDVDSRTREIENIRSYGHALTTSILISKSHPKLSLWTAYGGSKFSYLVFWKAYPCLFLKNTGNHNKQPFFC